MARWRLQAPHYINVVQDHFGTKPEWEYSETDRNTGRIARKTFVVPLYLDPNDPSSHNYPGEVIVAAFSSRANGRDIIFFGDPTPDMEPIDDEAEAISEGMKSKWKHPIDSLPGDMSASLISEFERQMAALVASNRPAQPVSPSAVGEDAFQAMTERMARMEARMQAMAERNAELEALASAPAVDEEALPYDPPRSAAVRRI